MMINLFLIFISSIVFLIYSIVIGNIIYKENYNFKLNDIILFFIVIMYFYAKIYLLDASYIIFCTFFVFVLIYKFLFNKNMFQSLLGASFGYMVIAILEYFLRIFVNNLDIFGIKYFVCHMIIFIIGILLFIIFKKTFQKIFEIAEKIEKNRFFLLLVIYINVTIITLLESSILNLNYLNILHILIMFFLVGSTFLNINQDENMTKFIDLYQEMSDYAKLNENLLNEYRMNIHENDNKLLVIKSMLKGKKKEVENYIDTILNESKKITNTWLSDLKYIPSAGIKNFLNYKLIKMKELGSQIEIVISSDLENQKNQEQSELYTILGVILDNMIDALKTDKKRLVSIQMYLKNDKINMEFVNSYSNKLDINKIRNFKYSTKGKDRGVGLSLVDKIVKESNIYHLESKLVDEFFVQHLTIELK